MGCDSVFDESPQEIAERKKREEARQKEEEIACNRIYRAIRLGDSKEFKKALDNYIILKTPRKW